MCVVALIVSLAQVSHGEAAVQATGIATIGRVNTTPINGRAICASRTWLLNQASELVEISVPDGRIQSHPLRGLASTARPRGLACLADGTLWTLETPRTVVRIASGDQIAERVELRFPRVALFAAGGLLLFHQLPTMVGEPVLATGLPGRSADVRPWLGLVGRNGATQEERLARNLVTCGIGAGVFVPCWFADESVLSVSNGVTPRSHHVAALKARSVDQQLPIWDAALVPSGQIWLLATAAQSSNGRRVGGQLLVIDRSGAVRRTVNLAPPARLIVEATEARCLLLTVEGQLMEVRAQ